MTEWHHIKTFYGYEVSIPEDYTYKEFINILDELNDILKEPFQFKSLISGFYMDITLNEPSINNSASNIIIGFYVNDIENIIDLSKELAEYIDNPLMEGIEISKNARFYSGIDSFNVDDVDDDVDDDEENEEDEENDDEENDDEDDNDDDEDDNDDDEDKNEDDDY